MKTTVITGLLSLSVLTMFTASAQSSDKVLFIGKVDPKYNGTKVFLYNNITGDSDSAKVTNGSWHIERPFTVATRHLLSSEAEVTKNGGYAPFGILIDSPGDITVEGDLEAFVTSRVSGSKPQDILNQYDSLMQEQNADEPSIVARLISKNADSFAAAFLLDRYGPAMSPEDALKAYDRLSASVKQTYFGKSAYTWIQGALQSRIGNTVADFILPNEKGEHISFVSLKGKYVLLDFWASWCGPCIEEFGNMKVLYAKYKGKAPFEILSISTDKSEQAWKVMLQRQQLPWLQILDNKEDKLIATSRFAVTSLPTTFLIDPDGKIIAKDLRGKQLQEKLTKLFN